MKTLIAFAMMMFSAAAFANEVTIACTQGDYTVYVATASIGGKGHGGVSMPMFVLTRNGQTVGTGNLQLLNEGPEDFLNAYVLNYKSADQASVIGVAIPGLKKLEAGEYQASADLLIQSGGQTVMGSTVPCTVTVK